MNSARVLEPNMDPRVSDTLKRLHKQSDRDLPRIARGFLRSFGRKLRPHHMRDAWIAIGRDDGRRLMQLVQQRGAVNIVEFGASFGISAIWLGAGARLTGGRVTTTEIEHNKVTRARQHVREAGLEDVVRVLDGDALATLADHHGPVDLLFFDGWSDIYDQLLDLLEPKLADEATLVVDNASFRGTARFLERLSVRPGWTLSDKIRGRMAVASFDEAGASDSS